MKTWTLALALGTAVATTAIGLEANPASAGTFAISFTIDEGNGVTEDVVGQFVTGSTKITDPMTGFMGYEIISFTGTQDGNPISLLRPGTFGRPGFPNNNLFNLNFINDPNDPAFDLKGVSYNVMELAGLEPYQLYYDGMMDPPYRGFDDSGSPNLPYPVTGLKITPVPEPTSTLGLLALGTLGAASTLKRKLKSSKSSENETEKVG